MMITLHLSDGRKITKDDSKLKWFSTAKLAGSNCAYADISGRSIPDIEEGCITINLDHVVDMRPAEPDEIEHAKKHGW